MSGTEVENRQWVLIDVSKKVFETTLFGVPLHIHQDHESLNVGTTLWDSSLVLAKLLEARCHDDPACLRAPPPPPPHTAAAAAADAPAATTADAPAAGTAPGGWGLECLSRGWLRGKRAVELGAGCGLAGMALALSGADVLSTDIPAVLPLLRKNARRNYGAANLKSFCLPPPPESRGPGQTDRSETGRVSKGAAKSKRRQATGTGGVLRGASTSGACSIGPVEEPGKLKVQQLVWGKAEDIAAAKGPFDVILATDVVYIDELVELFLNTVLALASEKTVILFGYEVRSKSAHEMFWPLCRSYFDVTQVPHEMMAPDYEDALIDIYVMRKKAQLVSPQQPSKGDDGSGTRAFAASPENLEPTVCKNEMLRRVGTITGVENSVSNLTLDRSKTY